MFRETGTPFLSGTLFSEGASRPPAGFGHGAPDGLPSIDRTGLAGIHARSPAFPGITGFSSIPMNPPDTECSTRNEPCFSVKQFEKWGS